MDSAEPLSFPSRASVSRQAACTSPPSSANPSKLNARAIATDPVRIAVLVEAARVGIRGRPHRVSHFVGVIASGGSSAAFHTRCSGVRVFKRWARPAPSVLPQSRMLTSPR